MLFYSLPVGPIAELWENHPLPLLHKLLTKFESVYTALPHNAECTLLLMSSWTFKQMLWLPLVSFQSKTFYCCSQLLCLLITKMVTESREQLGWESELTVLRVDIDMSPESTCTHVQSETWGWQKSNFWRRAWSPGQSLSLPSQCDSPFTSGLPLPGAHLRAKINASHTDKHLWHAMTQ